MLLSTEQAGILRWTILHRSILIITLYFSSAVQLSFDTSAWIQLQLDATNSPLLTSLALPLLRWDTLHFLAMASPRPLPLPSSASFSGQEPIQARGGGLQFENSLAFQPGIMWLLRILGSRSTTHNELDWSPSQAVLLTSVLTTVLSALQPLLLFSLTERLSADKRHSKTAAYLSILSPSPCSLITPTPESFFSFFALLGHLCLSFTGQSNRLTRTFMAAICYALATAFRSNGILLIGFILWTLFWQDPLPSRYISLLYAPILLLICIVPLLLSQSFAFARFCLSDGVRREWCYTKVPSVYTFVQDHYWNVGFFRYWTISQLPNWLMAFPPLIFAVHFVQISYMKDMPLIIKKSLTPWRQMNENDAGIQLLLPHVHFTLITLLILLFNSHIQIILRFASPGGLPAAWWGASYLILQHYDTKAKMRSSHWTTSLVLPYLVLWNMTSTVLYSGFYPPA